MVNLLYKMQYLFAYVCNMFNVVLYPPLPQGTTESVAFSADQSPECHDPTRVICRGGQHLLPGGHTDFDKVSEGPHIGFFD